MPDQQAFVVRQFAGENWAAASSVISIPIPEPKEGQVLVQVYLRPVNPTDVILLQTGYGGAVPIPAVVGSEGVAKVVKNGPGASRFMQGQRVIAVPWPQFEGQGTWQQYVVISEENLWAVPDSLDDKTAASAWINPVTIVSQLHELDIPKGEWLLQSAATSVLGRQMIALAKHKGIKTVNVVRRQEARQEILDAGGDAVIDSSSEDVAARVKEITGGKGAYACIDPIGGKSALALVSGLRPGGRYLVYGALDPSPLQVDHMDILAQGKQIEGFIIYNWIERPDKREVVQETLDLLEQKVIVPENGESYPLAEVQQAIRDSQKTGRGAKLFLEG